MSNDFLFRAARSSFNFRKHFSPEKHEDEILICLFRFRSRFIDFKVYRIIVFVLFEVRGSDYRLWFLSWVWRTSRNYRSCLMFMMLMFWKKKSNIGTDLMRLRYLFEKIQRIFLKSIWMIFLLNLRGLNIFQSNAQKKLWCEIQEK